MSRGDVGVVGLVSLVLVPWLHEIITANLAVLIQVSFSAILGADFALHGYSVNKTPAMTPMMTLRAPSAARPTP